MLYRAELRPTVKGRRDLNPRPSDEMEFLKAFAKEGKGGFTQVTRKGGDLDHLGKMVSRSSIHLGERVAKGAMTTSMLRRSGCVV